MSNLLKSAERQKGFTLIEMSIVLVIIGLIIGGILKGQEIINASRQKNLITQVDGVRSAINTFNDRFHSLPGTFAQATTRINALAVNGLGTGIVGANSATTAAIAAVDATGAGTAAGGTATAVGEPLAFWCQLAFVNLVGNSSTNCATAPTFFGNGSMLPSTAYGGSGLSVAYGTADTTTTGIPRTTLWLRMHRVASGTPAAGISGRNLAELDAKYDDGLPGTGSIRTGLSVADCLNTTSVIAYTPASATADNVTCMPLFDLVQ